MVFGLKYMCCVCYVWYVVLFFDGGVVFMCGFGIGVKYLCVVVCFGGVVVLCYV